MLVFLRPSGPPHDSIFFTGFPGVQIYCELGRSHEKCGENNETAMGVASYGLEFSGRGAVSKRCDWPVVFKTEDLFTGNLPMFT